MVPSGSVDVDCRTTARPARGAAGVTVNAAVGGWLAIVANFHVFDRLTSPMATVTAAVYVAPRRSAATGITMPPGGRYGPTLADVSSTERTSTGPSGPVRLAAVILASAK